MVPVEELKNLGVFSNLSDVYLKKISNLAEKITYTANRVIYMSKERAGRIFIVQSGLVSLRLFNPGAEYGLSFGMRDKGDLFGGASFLKPQKHTVTAVCLKDTTLFVIESSKLWETFDDDPELGYKFMKEIAQIYFDRYLSTEEQLHEMVKAPTIITALPG